MAHKLFFYCCLFLLFSACSHAPEVEKEVDITYCLTDSLLSKSSVDTVKSEAVMNELNMSGKIAFNEDNVVRVVALASGHVLEVKVSLGDYVNEGQVLAVVKSSDMAEYYNQFVSAKSNLGIAKKNLDAAKDFFKGGLNTQKDLLTAEEEYQKALSSFNRISEIVKIYGGSGNPNETSQATYYIKAPIAGFIVDKAIATGVEIRSDDNTNLFTISALKDVWVIANLYETDIEKIKEGYSAEVSTLSYKDKSFTGKINKMSNVLDPETKALSVRIYLDNPEYILKPGMFARVVVRYPEKEEMLAVPKNAVVFDDNKNYVVKYDDKCKIRMQQVNVVKTIGTRSYIENGADKDDGSIRIGDRIITRNSLFVFTALKKL